MYDQGWLIEQENHFPRHRWLRVQYFLSDGIPEPGTIDWTADANLALRFARKEDARLFAILHPNECRMALFTSHSFGLSVAEPKKEQTHEADQQARAWFRETFGDRYVDHSAETMVVLAWRAALSSRTAPPPEPAAWMYETEKSCAGPFTERRVTFSLDRWPRVPPNYVETPLVRSGAQPAEPLPEMREEKP